MNIETIEDVIYEHSSGGNPDGAGLIIDEVPELAKLIMAEFEAMPPRADGTVRMTFAQRQALWLVCGRYNVPFREDDYRPQFDLPKFYVAGWIGGRDGRDGNPKTVFVGVSPEGEVSS